MFRDEVGHILTFERNHIHMATFVKAFQAVWLRDYDTPIQMSSEELLKVLESMFERDRKYRNEKKAEAENAMQIDDEGDEEERRENKETKSVKEALPEIYEDQDERDREEDISTTILVTLTHMASKDYEKITRSG